MLEHGRASARVRAISHTQHRTSHTSQKGTNALKGLKLAATGAVTVSTALLGVAMAGVAQAAPAPAPACTPNVGNSGLSAAVVARPYQRIVDRTIKTSCDIGIYVGAGVSHVRIDNVRVSGASFEGIFAQKTSNLTIENSTITGNGFKTTDPSAPPLPVTGVHSRVSQAFGISLFGVSYSEVSHNKVADNGRGGIGLMDNGPNDPGTITQNTSAPLVSSSHDVIVDNRMSANYNGCGLVAATQNTGGSLSDLVLAGNTITGTGVSPVHGADTGGLVVAADLPNSSVSNVSVSHNQVTDSFEGGVIVNAEAFNSFTKNVRVIGNKVAGNNYGHQEAANTAGIIVFANPAPIPPKTSAPKNVSTVIEGNIATGQFYGIWSTGNYPPVTHQNHIHVTSGGTAIFRA